jgi:hypothetical protein
MSHLRAWLAEGNKQWRIIVPTFLGHRDAFIVYPGVTRYGDYCGDGSDDVFTAAAERMLSLRVYEHARERAEEEGWLSGLKNQNRKS